jgi:cyclic lactone autoinducer peptide
MNLAQRIVLSLALAAALAIAARTFSELFVNEAFSGWFTYQPNASTVVASSRSDSDSLRVAAVWLVAVAVWLGISWRLFRTKSD